MGDFTQKKLLELKPEYVDDKLVKSLRLACQYVLDHPKTKSAGLMAGFLASLHSDYPATLNSCIGFLDSKHVEWLMDSMRAVYVHKIEPHEFFKDNWSLFREIAKRLPKLKNE